MKLTVSVALILSLESLAFAGGCYWKCSFHFCDGTTKFNINRYAPDTPFKGLVYNMCGKIILVAVDESGEALIVSKYHGEPFVRISNFYPKVLRQKFSPSFFNTISVKRYYKTKYGKVVYRPFFDYGYSTPQKYASVGREISQKGQIEFLNKKYVVVSFIKYQKLDIYGRHVVESIRTSHPFVYCVSFKVSVLKKERKYSKKIVQ